MKTALCLYGMFTHHSVGSGQNGYRHIKERILSKVPDADIFCHSWSVDEKEIILDLYNPKKSIIENQIDFSDKINPIDIERYQQDYNASIPCGFNFDTLFRTFSFFYTRSKSIELKKQYEEENNFTYDCVIVCRYDLDFKSGPESHITFDPNNDMSYVYSAWWPQLNAGMSDMWFYSNSKNMDMFINMVDRLSSYLTPNSEFEKLLSAWPDSNPNDHSSSEVLLPVDKKSQQLYKYGICDCLNNHLIHKYFMIETNLYEKCKFLKG